MQVPRATLVVGRIKNFLRCPEKLLPVSCTVYVIEDNFENDNILDSFLFTSKALRTGAGVAIHLHAFQARKRYQPFRFYVTCSPSHPDFHTFSALPNFVPNCETIGRVISVADSMTEDEPDAVSIERSWCLLIENAQAISAEDLVMDFSRLRPEGTTNNYGLVASGPTSFALLANTLYEWTQHSTLTNLAACYSRMNEILRRGGLYKNGAVVLHLDMDHPCIGEFLEIDREKTPWVRLAVNVNQQTLAHPLYPKLLNAIESGDYFAVKQVFRNGKRLFHNVCLEVLLEHRGTCLLSHVNLGATEISEIPQAFVETMQFLLDLHPVTGVERLGIYRSPQFDKQVGLGVVGLASLLAIEGVSYQEFTEALEAAVANSPLPDTKAGQIARAITIGYQNAAALARKAGMERAFAIAPTANSSFTAKDREGYVVTPEISPPLDRQVVRLSETTELKIADYHPNVEIASEVGWPIYKRLMDAWYRLQEQTGLAHSISSNWWVDQVDIYDWFPEWLRGPWLSLYYALPVALETSGWCEMNGNCSSCSE